MAFHSKTIRIFDIRPATTRADIEHLLYDYLAPRILAHSGALVLHGSTVEIDGVMALFLGETGAGKSTLAASLYEAGYALHGDDAVIIESDEAGFTARAVDSTLRLYPETVSAILGDDVGTAPMAHYSPKLRVLLESSGDDRREAVPIGALFMLARESDGEARQAGPVTEALSPSHACMALLEQSFALDPHDASKAAARLARISALAGAKPVYRLTYPRDLARVGEVHEVIRDCLRQSQAGKIPGSYAEAD